MKNTAYSYNYLTWDGLEGCCKIVMQKIKVLDKMFQNKFVRDSLYLLSTSIFQMSHIYSSIGDL